MEVVSKIWLGEQVGDRGISTAERTFEKYKFMMKMHSTSHLKMWMYENDMFVNFLCLLVLLFFLARNVLTVSTVS